MPIARLYSQNLNPFTEKVLCALAIKGVECERVLVTEPDEIARLSPELKLLPVLEIEGQRMADSPAILRWLEELYPEPSLFAEDPVIRKQQESLAAWSDSSFAWYWNRWRLAVAEKEREQESPATGLLSRLHQRVERRIGSEAEANDEPSPREIEIMAEVESRLDDLVGLLANREYFYSDRPSAADVSVYGMLLVMREGPMPGSAALLAARPTLVEHLRRMDRLARG